MPAILAFGVLVAFAWTLYFLYEKSQEKPIVFKTAKPSMENIVQKTVAAGSIVPRREVAIKPRVSGVLQELAVEPGQYVKTGDLIAQIKIIPDMVNLNSAEARVTSAEISLKNAKREFERLKQLFDQKLIFQTEFSRAELDYELARQELSAAKNNLQLVREGAIRGSGKVSNQVRSTVEGMVIEVPVEEGVSVTETNNFNEGTTIASVADMNDMIFQGYVDESEVGKLKEDMPVSIKVGAIDGQRFEGVLEYISPKGVDKEGTIEFEVRAALELKNDSFIRANYSANADIILDKRETVLSLEERVIEFDKGKPYVQVEVSPQKFERRTLELGLSDGIKVEILDGLEPGEAVKVPNAIQNGVGANGH